MAARCMARRLGAPRRYNNASSSVIAFGDATFPPGWGRLVGCVLQASPHRGDAGERSETDEGADGRSTGDVSPPGEVLSMDGKYPKIPGSADPDPKRTFGKRSKFVRRGRELGAAASSARCRSCRSNQVTPLFSHCASHVPCLFGSIGGRPDGGDFPLSRGNVPQGQRG